MKCVLACLCLLPALVFGHDAPNPLVHWDFQQKFVKGGVLQAQKGPDLKVGEVWGKQKWAFLSRGEESLLTVKEVKGADLPPKDLTVSAWVSVHQGVPYGGIVGFFQDNGSDEQGWLLGYNQKHFLVALRSKGNDRMTYLAGKTAFVPGKYYHVCATYNGTSLKLYVNGKLDAESAEQKGAIVYPGAAKLAVGGYVDANENFPMTGSLKEVLIYDLVATAEGVAHDFEHNKVLADQEPAKLAINFEFEAKPFLQMAGTDSMGVNWATNLESDGQLFWGENSKCENALPVSQKSKTHQLRITGLQPDTQYFYRTTTTDSEGRKLESEVRTFETAPMADSPIAFAVISDTQGNPRVASKMANFAWAQRPDFLVIPGDLTSTGTELTHWTKQFFPSMEVLISRVPMYPVLGNHERNADYYYDYMNLPDPEYYYTFTYGPAQFFMVDSNKKCGPGSEQYLWLEKQLKASKAEWKIVVHHHPVYSSDANDYGNLWEQNKSSRGDRNVRAMSKLYDLHGVDLVFNGHIHSYERTWQVKNGKVVSRGGVQYFVTGGGGGPLEEAGPSRPPFQNTVKHGHHYAMVRINGDVFEWQAYDLEGKLFDSLRYRRERK